MNPIRKRRLVIAGFIFAGSSLAVALALLALNENLNLFYPPDQVVSGVAPTGTTIRAGGMVREGSVARDGDSLEVRFVLTDHQGSDFTVVYAGILPDLFREGQGVLVQGRLLDTGVFDAAQVLAKHDENYMPPELAGMKTAARAEGGRQ